MRSPTCDASKDFGKVIDQCPEETQGVFYLLIKGTGIYTGTSYKDRVKQRKPRQKSDVRGRSPTEGQTLTKAEAEAEEELEREFRQS